MDDVLLKPFLRKVKNLLLQESYQTILATSLSVAVIFPLATSCTEDYYTQSVHTTIKEISPHQFVISDETLYDLPNESYASIYYLDGNHEVLLFDSLWQRLDESRAVFSRNHSFDNLSEIVAYSAIGNMLSVDRRRQLYPYYQEPLHEEDYWRRRMVQCYIDELTYQHSQQVNTSMAHHTTSRSSGFFSSSSHGHARG